jgi:hypothetical protein
MMLVRLVVVVMIRVVVAVMVVVLLLVWMKWTKVRWFAPLTTGTCPTRFEMG